VLTVIQYYKDKETKTSRKDLKKGIVMKILVACEESQRVTIEFRKLGHEAYSCDLLDCSGNHPEWHIKKDVTLLLNGNCIFYTVDGVEHEISGKWDMIIAFPPCTYLTVTGNRWFNYEKYGNKAIQRMLDRNDAIKFFMTIANADCDKIAIENPAGIMSTKWRKPDQIIQPFEYGDAFEKRTCLWLKGLKKLIPTKIVEIPDRMQFKSGKTKAKWYVEAGNLSKEQRALVRSKTFPGIAKAMANQWGKEDCKTLKDGMEVRQESNSRLGIEKTSLPCLTCNHFCVRFDNERIKMTHCVRKNTENYLEAAKNPNWHNVSLKTLANIDFDMLDEKRQVYFSLYRKWEETLKNLRKCSGGHSYERCYSNFRRLYITAFQNRKISSALVMYFDKKISMVNVECGVWSSAVEVATGQKESRKFNRQTLRY
jgi:hypothetical protein